MTVVLYVLSVWFSKFIVVIIYAPRYSGMPHEKRSNFVLCIELDLKFYRSTSKIQNFIPFPNFLRSFMVLGKKFVDFWLGHCLSVVTSCCSLLQSRLQSLSSFYKPITILNGIWSFFSPHVFVGRHHGVQNDLKDSLAQVWWSLSQFIEVELQVFYWSTVCNIKYLQLENSISPW